MLKQIKRDAIKSRQVAELEGLRKELMRVEQEISAEVKAKEHKSVYVPAASKTTRVSIGSEERSGVSISIKEEDGEGSSDDSEPGEAEDANDVVGLADSPKEKEEDDDNDEGVYSSFADPELSIATELEESIASQSGQESIPAPAPPSAESKRSHNHRPAPHGVPVVQTEPSGEEEESAKDDASSSFAPESARRRSLPMPTVISPITWKTNCSAKSL